MVWEPEILRVDGPFGPVPATLYVSRDVVEVVPPILLGHGADTSKDDPTMRVLAVALARGVGAGVAALDCPGHGERLLARLDDAGFNALVQANMTDPAVFDQLAIEWPLVAARGLRLLATLGSAGSIAYAGFSMGSVFGFGIVPRLDDVNAVLLAVGGLLDEQADDPVTAERNAARNRIIRDGAARFGDRQVLMTNMTRDEALPDRRRARGLRLAPGSQTYGRVGRNP